jgi:hypothetical protein
MEYLETAAESFWDRAKIRAMNECRCGMQKASNI